MRIILEPDQEQEAEGKCRIEMELAGAVSETRLREMTDAAIVAFFHRPKKAVSPEVSP